MLNVISNEEIESILKSTGRFKKALKSKDTYSEVIDKFNKTAQDEINNSLRANIYRFKERTNIPRQI